jgi:hypothetical protein
MGMTIRGRGKRRDTEEAQYENGTRLWSLAHRQRDQLSRGQTIDSYFPRIKPTGNSLGFGSDCQSAGQSYHHGRRNAHRRLPSLLELPVNPEADRPVLSSTERTGNAGKAYCTKKVRGYMQPSRDHATDDTRILARPSRAAVQAAAVDACIDARRGEHERKMNWKPEPASDDRRGGPASRATVTPREALAGQS